MQPHTPVGKARYDARQGGRAAVAARHHAGRRAEKIAEKFRLVVIRLRGFGLFRGAPTRAHPIRREAAAATVGPDE